MMYYKPIWQGQLKKIDAKRMRYDLREMEHRITDFYRKHKQMADSPEIDFCLLDN